MHVVLLVVRLRRLGVLDSAEACQTFIADKRLHRVQVEDANIHSEIKLEPVK